MLSVQSSPEPLPDLRVRARVKNSMALVRRHHGWCFRLGSLFTALLCALTPPSWGSHTRETRQSRPRYHVRG